MSPTSCLHLRDNMAARKCEKQEKGGKLRTLRRLSIGSLVKAPSTVPSPFPSPVKHTVLDYCLRRLFKGGCCRHSVSIQILIPSNTALFLAGGGSALVGSGFGLNDEAITMCRVELERLQYILHFPEEVSTQYLTKETVVCRWRFNCRRLSTSSCTAVYSRWILCAM